VLSGGSSNAKHSIGRILLWSGNVVMVLPLSCASRRPCEQLRGFDGCGSAMSCAGIVTGAASATALTARLGLNARQASSRRVTKGSRFQKTPTWLASKTRRSRRRVATAAASPPALMMSSWCVNSTMKSYHGLPCSCGVICGTCGRVLGFGFALAQRPALTACVHLVSVVNG